ncbi:DUF2207 domain-containing protein [Calidifontibacter terrae]
MLGRIIIIAIMIVVVVSIVPLLRRILRGNGKVPLFEGVAPGIIPANPDSHPVVNASFKALLPSPPPPRFEPPQLILPWMTGEALGRGISGRDMGAMLIDLAVRGYIRIDKAPNWRKKNPRFVFTRTDKRIREGGAVAEMRDLLFPFHSKQTDSADLRRRASGPAGRTVRHRMGFEAGQAIGTDHKHPTAVRTALTVQLRCFQQYLSTAEVSSIKVDEAAGIFSRYLPWAVALGEAEHWAKTFQGVILEAQASGSFSDIVVLSSWSNDLAWWGGFDSAAFDGVGIDAGSFDASSFHGVAAGVGVFDAAAFGDSLGGFGDSIGDIGSGMHHISSDVGGGSSCGSSSCGGGSSCGGSGSSCGSSCGGGGGCGSS